MSGCVFRAWGCDRVRRLGLLLLGVPDTGKSGLAKALGNEVGRPTLQMDVGALMGSLVGQSEANLRQALKVAEAMGKVEQRSLLPQRKDVELWTNARYYAKLAAVRPGDEGNFSGAHPLTRSVRSGSRLGPAQCRLRHDKARR